MKAVFIALPPFERHRQDYLDDDGFRRLQDTLMANPEAGDLIEGTGGLRKLRFGDPRRSKGKRGGLDLTPKQRAALKELLKGELKMRKAHEEKEA